MASKVATGGYGRRSAWGTSKLLQRNLRRIFFGVVDPLAIVPVSSLDALAVDGDSTRPRGPSPLKESTVVLQYGTIQLTSSVR